MSTETNINDRIREAQDALDEARLVSRAMRKAFTDCHRTAIRSWARALANREIRPAEHAALWTGFEMGVREAMVSMSLDLDWTEAEWDAVEVAAQQMAQKMIEASE